MASLDSTIASFQDLCDSIVALSSDFERESSGLDQDIRRQLEEFKGFNSQAQQVHALEERMKLGKEKANLLSSRLRATGSELDDMETKELGLQTRINQRLRILWAVVAVGILSIIIAITVKK